MARYLVFSALLVLITVACCPYNAYLVRVLSLGEGKVYAMAGRMPTTPDTRDGQAVMEPAQARYWSVCHTGRGKDAVYNTITYGCLMDDEVTLTENRDFVVVYSRPEDRPSNAWPMCGVTWQDYCLETGQAFTLRWMSVYPDHHTDAHNPSDSAIP